MKKKKLGKEMPWRVSDRRASAKKRKRGGSIVGAVAASFAEEGKKFRRTGTVGRRVGGGWVDCGGQWDGGIGREAVGMRGRMLRV